MKYKLVKYPEIEEYLENLDPEEVFYDVIMKIWNNIDSYNQKKSNFESWIAVIAKYSALDRLRKILKILKVKKLR